MFVRRLISVSIVLVAVLGLSACPHFEEIPEFQGGQSDGGPDVEIDGGECTNAGDCSNLPNAIATCNDGTCAYECATTHVDKDNDLGANGCECEIEDEVCDGVDNDCDGLVDNAFTEGMVSAGDGRSCAVDDAGRVFCWGTGFLGEGGEDEQSLKPQRVSEISGTANFVAAQHGASCVVSQQGVVSCWGDNTSGKLGVGSDSATVLTPTSVSQPQGVSGDIRVGIGETFACFVTPGASAPNVACAGSDEQGELGTEAASSSNEPQRTSLSQAAEHVAVGDRHACAVIPNGGVKCWGNNGVGQLGTGLNESSSPTPKSISDSRVASNASAGVGFSCAIVSDATLCWGDGQEGQLGREMTQSAEPVEVALGETQLSGISSEAATTCGWTSNGTVWCWGASLTGGEPAQTPVEAEFSQSFTSVDVGASHACGIDETGRLWCWGRNADGQLGSGNSGGVAQSPIHVTCSQ